VTRRLSDISSGGGITVFSGAAAASGDEQDGLPLGIALYQRPGDGAIFAIVSRKHGPKRGYLWQYRLQDDGRGRVSGLKVREFGNFSASKEIEAIAADSELGYVYYSDEDIGIHKWHADPDHPRAGEELALFGKRVFQGDREGIAIYKRSDGTRSRSTRGIICMPARAPRAIHTTTRTWLPRSRADWIPRMASTSLPRRSDRGSRTDCSSR